MPRESRLVGRSSRAQAPWELLRLHSRSPRRAYVSLHTHALADFLFYGLYRTDHLGLRVPIELSDVPPAACYGHFPQYVALRGVDTAEALPALVEGYYGEDLSRYDIPRDELLPRVAALVPRYRDYRQFWDERVWPLESQLLDGWREQLKSGETLDLLQRLTRLRWPFPRLRLFACYHHPSGSALTPYPYLFTTLFDPYAVEPSAAWFLGHEALHLLLDAVMWWEHPDAPGAIGWLGSRHLAEEALCLVLQNRMATVCGLLPESEMQVLKGSMKHLKVYRWLQEHWEDYLEDPASFPTLVEFLLTGVREARETYQRSRHRNESDTSTARTA